MVMPQVFTFVPYRDTSGREQVVNAAIDATKRAYEKANLPASYYVRPGYFFDIQSATPANSTSPYDNSNAVAFSTTTNLYGMSYVATFNFVVPLNKVFTFYGISDTAPDPVLRLWVMQISDTQYKPIYLSPQLLTDEDKQVILNGPFRSIPPNTPVSIQLFSNQSGTDNIDFLFFVGEQGVIPQEE